MFSEEDIIKDHKLRADIIGIGILFFFAVIFSRLWFLQIYKGEELYRYSLENRLRREIITAPRGMIFSRNNDVLIYNIPRFDAVITPQYLKNKEQSIHKLARILDMKLADIEKVLKKNRAQAKYLSIIIKKNISRKEVAVIETENFKMPGVSVRIFNGREYTDKEVGGHVLGYISEISRTQLPRYRKRDNYKYRMGDFVGQSGIEEKMDLILRGSEGHEFMEVDATGKRSRRLKADNNLFKGIENKMAVPGHNIRLTIDRDLQASAYRALKGRVGSAVAIDVNTGEVLAMISRPSFNPSLFSRGISRDYWKSIVENDKNPLRDRTIQEHYSPGSTFKLISAIAAMEEGIVDERTEVSCKGYFRAGRRNFHCWRWSGHGKVNMVRALRESCDVYFYKIATKLDIDILARYAKLFGLGKKTGIGLPRETSGLIPTKAWKKKRNGKDWHLGETLSCVIGQSYILTTPIQLALIYATIANGGRLYRPQIIREVFSNSGKIIERPKPQMVSQINLGVKTLRYVKKGLFEAVNTRKGTAWGARGEGLSMSGKTGTSQVIRMSAERLFSKCEENEYKHRHHALFVGYAPVKKPEIAVSVVVEHGCQGSKVAAPIARDIITTYMDKYHRKSKKTASEKEEKKNFPIKKSVIKEDV